MYGKFWALIPPVVAIILALITKEAYSSLFIGIIIGALFVTGFNPVQTIDTIVNDGFVSAIKDNAGIFLFLILLGIIVALINSAGGSAAFGRWAEKNIKTKVGAQMATFVLGVLIFVDDYFNCLTVGSVLRPITDSKKISRAKLSYLIDATAAPICMIAPISSWAAAVASVASDMNTGINGIQLFCKAIFYNFYSLLTFVFVIGLVLMKFDYGPMVKFEKEAAEPAFDPLHDYSKPEIIVPDETEESVEPKVIEKPKPKPAPIIKNYIFPSIDLLNKSEGNNGDDANEASCATRTEIINRTLANLGIGAEIVSHTVGPSVTRFDLRTNDDVSITAVQRYIGDISVRLGGVQTRFEPIVAGKSTSGIEIPNEIRTNVSLREAVEGLPDDPRCTMIQHVKQWSYITLNSV